MSSGAFQGAVVRRRQSLFFSAVFLLFGVGFLTLSVALRQGSMDPWKWMLLVLFCPLFLQLCFGAVVAMAGFLVKLNDGDPLLISRLADFPMPSTGTPPATAVLIPIFNEDVGRVFQGLRLMYESLAATGKGGDFDFFVLSDSNDPNHWIEEEKAWVRLCKQVDGFGRIFYRKRRVALHQKSGNVADFCRRWGAKYRYMIVLDADSIMRGGAMVELVRLMEARRSAGMIQAVPRQVLARSLFARVQQFAAHVYGPLFAAGSNYWHLASGTYWGHNAIIRIKPFMEHCALPEMPKAGPFSGRFLSHDTVEAALMRAAGHGVWLAYDIEGSYEEGPPDVLAALARDRRWCLGNLQHITLLLKRGFRTESRIHLLLGIMSYVSGPLWLGFILLSVAETLASRHRPGSAAVGPAMLLFWLVMALLFAPKILGLWDAWRRRETSAAFRHGGRLLAGVALETLFSMLLAPIQMLGHTWFVLAAFLRIPTSWGGQNRGESRPRWAEVMLSNAVPTGLALLMTWVCWTIAPMLLLWLMPVLAGLVLSIPFVRFTSSCEAGEQTRRLGLFVIPEEADPPIELARIGERAETWHSPFFHNSGYREHFGLLQVILDPYVNAMHVGLLRARTEPPEQAAAALEALGKRLITNGPAELTPKEINTLLWNAEALVLLHRELWCTETSAMARWWRQALRHYNESNELMTRREMGDRRWEMGDGR